MSLTSFVAEPGFLALLPLPPNCTQASSVWSHALWILPAVTVSAYALLHIYNKLFLPPYIGAIVSTPFLYNSLFSHSNTDALLLWSHFTSSSFSEELKPSETVSWERSQWYKNEDSKNTVLSCSGSMKKEQSWFNVISQSNKLRGAWQVLSRFPSVFITFFWVQDRIPITQRPSWIEKGREKIF